MVNGSWFDNATGINFSKISEKLDGFSARVLQTEKNNHESASTRAVDMIKGSRDNSVLFMLYHACSLRTGPNFRISCRNKPIKL